MSHSEKLHVLHADTTARRQQEHPIMLKLVSTARTGVEWIVETHKIQDCALWGVRMHVGKPRTDLSSVGLYCIQVGGAK